MVFLPKRGPLGKKLAIFFKKVLVIREPIKLKSVETSTIIWSDSPPTDESAENFWFVFPKKSWKKTWSKIENGLKWLKMHFKYNLLLLFLLSVDGKSKVWNFQHFFFGPKKKCGKFHTWVRKNRTWKKHSLKWLKMA